MWCCGSNLELRIDIHEKARFKLKRAFFIDKDFKILILILKLKLFSSCKVESAFDRSIFIAV